MKEKSIVPEFIESRQPTHVGWVPNPDEFSKKLVTQRSGSYRWDNDFLIFDDIAKVTSWLPIPILHNLEHFAPTIQTIIDFQQAHYGLTNKAGNLYISQYYRHSPLPSSWHTDYVNKTGVSLYIVSNDYPTEFLLGTFSSHASSSRRLERTGTLWTPKPFEIVRYDSQTLHRRPSFEYCENRTRLLVGIRDFPSTI